jgi:hypothetical protein
MNEIFRIFFIASKFNPFIVMHEKVFWTLFAAMAGVAVSPGARG